MVFCTSHYHNISLIFESPGKFILLQIRVATSPESYGWDAGPGDLKVMPTLEREKKILKHESEFAANVLLMQHTQLKCPLLSSCVCMLPNVRLKRKSKKVLLSPPFSFPGCEFSNLPSLLLFRNWYSVLRCFWTWSFCVTLFMTIRYLPWLCHLLLKPMSITHTMAVNSKKIILHSLKYNWGEGGSSLNLLPISFIGNSK